ncbi:MAG: hypothetical protein ACTJHT_03765 [Sphingobacterium sp.]|uniref:hypothetical protein n=1 Tax=Sphingobacterium sp. JB170 TaxID=1434842 RepID=UPI00211ADC4C|nr:hypothetical protein [Sphingobacterium sp. JB170]
MKITQILGAKICFAVFFIKMVISATPMFVNILDQGTILQVVLQLEIENTAKGNYPSEDLHEGGTKFFGANNTEFFAFGPAIENLGEQRHYLKNERLIAAFHPTVPTPPPNG